MDEPVTESHSAIESTSASSPRRRCSDSVVFAGLALVFVAVSLASWAQPVSSMEMNRNDAACYLILAKNIVQHGVYSLDQAAPFQPHTEWPPGIPLLYALPMAFVDFPLNSVDTAVIHTWTLLISLTSLWLVCCYLRELLPQSAAFAITATLASTKAFLDSAQVPVADTVSVGVAFLLLHWMRRYFAETQPKESVPAARRKDVAWHVALALAPLVKPYLGMLHAAYLAKLWQRWWHSYRAEQLTQASSRYHFRLIHGIVTLGICCIPFAVFIGYSVTTARQTEQISAITWLTTDNPVTIQKEGEATDHKSLGEWISSGMGVLKYHLIYNATDAVLPGLSWFHLSNWPMVWRAPLLILALGAMGGGVIKLLRQGDLLSVAYASAMLLFFVVFACDSPRYFTVLSPMCGLFAWLGATSILGWCRKQYVSPTNVAPFAMMVSTALLIGAGWSSLAWVRHRSGVRYDAVPFYEELYTALHAARDDESISGIVVPFQLRDISIVETGKPVFTWKDYAEQRNSLPQSVAIIAIKHDPTGRILQSPPATLHSADTDSHSVAARLQFVELRVARNVKPLRALVRNEALR